MARRYFKKMSILAKIETTYGVDAVPTGAANAMLMTDVTITPLKAAQKDERSLPLGYDGNQGMLVNTFYGELQGSIELVGSGTAGTAPAWGPLMRACGMDQTITAGVSVAYAPVSYGRESVSLYFNLDGVLTKLLGVRGTWKLAFEPGKIPKIVFSLTGLFSAMTDTAFPTNTYTAFKTPVLVSDTNTTFSIHGVSVPLHSLDIDFGNKVELYLPVNSTSVEITGREVSGAASVEASSVAAKDWAGIFKARTRSTLSVVHGIAAGYIATLAAPSIEIGEPEVTQVQGIVANKIPLAMCPVSGDDELTLTLT